MRKIELSTEIEKKHMVYFNKKILPQLIGSQSKQYIYTTKEIRLLKVDRNYFIKKFPKQHSHFIGFIKNRYKIFAIGRPCELRKLQKKIDDEFPLISKMIKMNNHSSKHSYKDYLYELFGYDKFKVKDMYYYIKEKAQNIVGKKKYCEEVYKEMVKILIVNYPKQKDEIIEKLVLKEGFPSAEDFKKTFRKINRFDITMDNFNQFEIFGNEWNDYAFVMESGIRVCPYCNRQYITPIYSDNGKVRADIDHFLPKSKFPYFSMSLYNLVPVCKPCNQSLKHDREFSFDSISPYEAHISDYFTFKADVQTHEITIKINDGMSAVMQHIDTFKIETLYNYHRNQVKELIRKRIAYPDEYIQKLYEDNKAYFNSVQDVKQLIIGFIEDRNRFNDEAFLKLRWDLAQQLGFLNKNNSFRIAQLKAIIERKQSI